ncbi:MAG: DUF1552 domain-containing protein [Akkermansiaceae bacterium]
MKVPHLSTKKHLDRRSFLKGVGVAMGLPLLDSMTPAFAKSSVAEPPRRFLGICNNLGLLPGKFFPSVGTGYDYTLSPYLEKLAEHRDKFTVFSGVSHPDVDGGHPADICFLTAAPRPASSGFRNTISLDQYVAERIGYQTRFPSLTLGVNIKNNNRSLSFTGSGVQIPPEQSPSALYQKLFLQGNPKEIAEQQRKLSLGKSIMDAVARQVSGLQRKVSNRDKERLDQYYTGIRELEVRLEQAKEWEGLPKAKTDEKEPVDIKDPVDYMKKTELMYRLAHLAFETDSTRMITLMLDSVSSPAIVVNGKSVGDGYHNLSHHGKNPKKMAQLERIDNEHMRLLNSLITGLSATPEDQTSLLDRTMVLYGSNLGNASSHVTTNLPVLFAGGGFKHGQHLAFDKVNNYPLPNLYLSMLHRLGIDADKFASSTSTMKGLELV